MHNTMHSRSSSRQPKRRRDGLSPCFLYLLFIGGVPLCQAFICIPLCTNHLDPGSRIIFSAHVAKAKRHSEDGTARVRVSRGASSRRPKTRRRIRQPAPPYSGLDAFPSESTVVILYNKPAGVVTSHSNADLAPKDSDGKARMTVYQDVMNMMGYRTSPPDLTPQASTFQDVTGIHSKLHAIGRLDVETVGVLLLTNDGALVHHVTNPKASSSETKCQKLVTKTYEALVMGHHDMDESPSLQRILHEGVDLGPKHGKTQPAVDLKVLGHPTPKSTLVEITLAEGKNRQVRRTFHAVGSGVIKLRRTQIGNGLNVGELKEGQWRLLSNDEIERYLSWTVRKIRQR